MPGSETLLIDDYLRRLGRRLPGPRRCRADLLTEVRHSLLDASAAYRASGLSPTEAQRRAVHEFGTVEQLSAGYQAELAAGAVRTLALRVTGAWLLFLSAADLMWRGAPWSGSPPPPVSYRLLSDAIGWLWLGCGLAAVASLGWSTWNARRGRSGSVRLARTVGIGLPGALALGWLTAIAVFAWSVRIWTGALSWPPMVLGMALVSLVYLWLGRAALRCLASVR